MRQLLKAGLVDIEIVLYKARVTVELVSSVNTTGQHSEGTRTKFRNNRVPNHKVPSITKLPKLPSS